MKRLIDVLLALAALAVLWPLLLAVFVAVRCTSPGPALYWSQRVGRDNKLFAMPKFRSTERAVRSTIWCTIAASR